MSNERFQRQFLSQLADPRQLGALFDLLPDIYFFVKNRQGQFVMMNPPLLRKLGMAEEKQVIGKTDYDFFTRSVADHYRQEDNRVMRSGKPILNDIWMIPNSTGGLSWYIFSKLPLRGKDGSIIGVTGVLRDSARAGSVLGPYDRMSSVIDYIMAHHAETIDVAHLAAMTHLSVSQFERTFKKLFNITPLKYVAQVRINAARQLLTATDHSIALIAQRTGFYDHSYFVKQFRQHVGLTPTQYRRKYLAAK